MLEERIAICDMFTVDIRAEISARQLELLDPTLDMHYRRWSEDRIKALISELDLRGSK